MRGCGGGGVDGLRCSFFGSPSSESSARLVCALAEKRRSRMDWDIRVRCEE
jgi:hypothetical protein